MNKKLVLKKIVAFLPYLVLCLAGNLYCALKDVFTEAWDVFVNDAEYEDGYIIRYDRNNHDESGSNG